MIRIIEKEYCCGCSACVNICPKHCISLKTDSEGFVYPLVDEGVCIGCDLCDTVCPEKSCDEVYEYKTNVYMGYANDDVVRLKSSSGGFFRLIADYVIDKNGVVFGAMWDEKFNVKHVLVDTKQELYKIMGSKYVQSEIGDTYIKAKHELDKNRIVLFSGTPCQIVGLLSFLKKPYENLITVDFICHGVPSPKVWQYYLKARENEFKSKVSSVFFRDKCSGWKKFSVRMNFENGNEYVKTYNNDSYMNLFLNDYSLRPSCYECSFKTVSRKSDITLADFWGVDNFFEISSVDKGVSLAFIHSDMGEKVFESISSELLFKQAVDIKSAIKYNSAIVLSSRKPPKRKIFFEKVFSANIDKIANKYCREKLEIRIKREVFQMFKKYRIR